MSAAPHVPREFLAFGDRMLVLLDIEAMMASAEMGLIAAAIQ